MIAANNLHALPLTHSSEVASMVLEKVTDEGKGKFMQIVRYVASCVPCF